MFCRRKKTPATNYEKLIYKKYKCLAGAKKTPVKVFNQFIIEK